jgi:hypothetical protein
MVVVPRNSGPVILPEPASGNIFKNQKQVVKASPSSARTDRLPNHRQNDLFLGGM